MGLAARTAVVVRDGVELEVPIEQVAVGDIVLVRPGRKSRSTAPWSRGTRASTSRC